jgi:predicted dehydrogenase
VDLRLAVIGCGRLAERGYLPAARRARGISLAAVADPIAERCALVAPGIPSFRSATDVLAARAADVLVLATPASAHLADARKASELGLPTLVEKPPALDAQAAAALEALSPPPWIGFNRRFEPGIARLRSNAPQVDMRLLLFARRSSWRAHEVRDDVLLDLGPHLFDLALWLSSGRPARVSARRARGRWSILLELADGRGSARLVIGNRPYLERFEVRARGEAGRRHEAGGLLRGLRAVVSGDSYESPLVPSLTLQLESLARAVRGGHEPDLATAADGLLVMQMIDAVRASAEGGGRPQSLASTSSEGSA